MASAAKHANPTMKTSNLCPKCQSKDILNIPGQAGPFGSGNNIAIGRTIFSSIKVTRFVCAACGFSEEWINNRADIDKLKSKFG